MQWTIYKIDPKSQESNDYIININRDNEEPQITGIYTITPDYDEFKRINNLTAFFEDNNDINYYILTDKDLKRKIKERVATLIINDSQNIESNKLYYDDYSRSPIKR